VLSATAILFVSGILGVLLRNSQASEGLGRLTTTRYAVMTVRPRLLVSWAGLP
jgi:hypothetical protein